MGQSPLEANNRSVGQEYSPIFRNLTEHYHIQNTHLWIISPDKPGRVATLVEDKESIVWGRAFEVRGEAALPYLDTRECQLGGYHVQLTSFFPHKLAHRLDSDSTSGPQPTSFPALFYVATPSNRLWLGDAPLTEIASQIVECSGPSGHNVEYLLRLAGFMHEYLPEAVDEHLFTLEFLVRSRIKEQNLCLKTLMGDSLMPASPPATPPHELEDADENNAIGGDPAVRPDSFQFTSRVPPKKLRCLNI
ncbi:glutathione-specific gamma-glutamylcyclotransferase 1 isoform X2 [Cryptotermes secundus]|uniref:glutathione-specific gamma-glutamylcyclotransferase 1 isoform X2 n=1 Tax=Cryptotermes secundus TaxID=105785 RepID=UPI001454E202|nr:glutathione-specific gamma-glutamylcyclotransferase 1 isoform X2 [Cryptotermes secundus]